MAGHKDQRELGTRASLPPARLRGGWLLLARMAWIVLTATCIGLFVTAIPARYAAPGRPFSNDLWGAVTLGFTVQSYTIYTIVRDLFTVLAYCTVAVLLFWRKSDERGPLLIAAFLVLVGTLGTETVAVAAPLPVPLGWIGVGEIAVPALLFLFFLFPDGRFVPRWAPLIWVAIPVLFTWSGNGWTLTGSGLDRALPWLEPLTEDWGWEAFILGLIGLPLYAQIYRYRRVSGPRERQQTKWALLGFGGAMLIIAGLTIADGLIGSWGVLNTYQEVNPRWALLEATLMRLAWLLVPLTIGAAILRSHLYDIDVLINRTLVYTSLTLVLGLVYVGGVAALQLAIGGRVGGSSQLPIVASTLGTIGLARPLRARLQATIDRRFYRRKYDAARVMAAFGTMVRDETELERLRADLLATVDEAMQPAHVTLWLRSTGKQP